MKPAPSLTDILTDHQPIIGCRCGETVYNGTLWVDHVAAALTEQFNITPKNARRSILWRGGRNVWSTEWLRPVVKPFTKLVKDEP
jgi:hypothetical protein